MEAYWVSKDAQQPDLWQQTVLPDLEVGPGQVLIKVRATSLNYRDLMIAKGRYGSPSAKELIPLSDGAGEIIAVGAGVTQWKVGDRVCDSFFTDWKSGIFLAEYHSAALGGSSHGMLGEYIVLPAHGVVRIGDGCHECRRLGLVLTTSLLQRNGKINEPSRALY